MTSKNKKHNKRSRKTKVKGKRGGENRYYNENNPDRDSINTVDSVDEGMKEVFTTLGIKNEGEPINKGWLAVGVVGVIGVVLLGVTVIKRR
jgi:hypothetical protein